MSDAKKVSTWWAVLRAIAVFNALLWSVTCLPLAGGSERLRLHVLLSGIYVAVCAFRSWLPRIDLERYCLVDTPLSSMVLGRTAATLAEVSFAAQVALSLHQIGELTQLPWIVSVSYVVVPLLTIAQLFCWYSVLTLNHLGHAIEQSLWTFTMALVFVCSSAALFHLHGPTQAFVALGAVIALGFVVFMVIVDVPMYLRRWREGRLNRRRYLTFGEGFRDALYRRVTTREWATWRPEVLWLTGYFSFAVWLSVALVHFSNP